MQCDPVLSAVVEAERVWERLLRRSFGREASFLRNTEFARGEPGSPLRAAYEHFVRTKEYWAACRGLPDGDVRWIRDQR